MVEVIVVPGDSFEGACETFCEKCGHLRLWLKPEYPDKCGNCGEPAPLVGGIGGKLLKRLRDEWAASNLP